METHITVIGAGFCGTALVRALAQTADAQVRITLVGVAETFGSGIAYGAARPEHLLNVRAKDLGIDAQVPGAFADTPASGRERPAGIPCRGWHTATTCGANWMRR